MTTDDDELRRLRGENARLIGLLDDHGIAWHGHEPVPAPASAIPLSTDKKVALFRRLFRGRTDVYPVRWESKAGKTGYSPACANEWRAGVCEKPRIKCSDCGNRLLVPVTEQTLYDHLAGRHTVGVYPLLTDDTCHFLAVDFDDADWGAMHKPSHTRVASWAFRPRSKSRARATAPMLGSSSHRPPPHGTHDGSARRSSATPAHVPGSSSSRPMTGCFRTRTRCLRAASAT